MPDALRLLGSAAVSVTLVLGAPCKVAGQDQDLVDSGAFEHQVGGSFAGRETFAVRRRGDGLLAVGRITREGGEEALRSFEVGMRLDASGLPIRYERRSREGAPLHIIVNRAGSRLTTTISSAAGERFNELLANDRLLVLDPEVAHHYALLARRIVGAADPRRLEVEALIPEDGRTVRVRVAGFSRDSLRSGGERVSATRYELGLGSETAFVWVGTSDGRVLQVAIPARGWSALREMRE